MAKVTGRGSTGPGGARREGGHAGSGRALCPPLRGRGAGTTGARAPAPSPGPPSQRNKGTPSTHSRPGPHRPPAPPLTPHPGARSDEKAQARQRGPRSGGGRCLGEYLPLRLGCARPGRGPAPPSCRRRRGFGAWCHVDNRKGRGKGALAPLDPARPLLRPARPRQGGPLVALQSLIGAGLLWKQGFLWDFSLHQQLHRKPDS